MSYNEADTVAKLITPAVIQAGWTEDDIRREVNAGAIEIIDGKARRGKNGLISRCALVLKTALNL